MDGRAALTVAALLLLASPAAALLDAAEASRATSRATLLDIVAVDLSGPANSTLGDQVLLTSRVANVGEERANNTTLELSWRLNGTLDPLVPFALYDFLAESYTRSLLAEKTPLPALILQPNEGRVLFESRWRAGAVGDLESALDQAFGGTPATVSAADRE